VELVEDALLIARFAADPTRSPVRDPLF
jgi:hypothetical protein